MVASWHQYIRHARAKKVAALRGRTGNDHSNTCSVPRGRCDFQATLWLREKTGGRPITNVTYTRVQRFAAYALALFFMTAGVLHFTASQFFVAIMPPYLPYHLPLVYLSGACEILCAVGVLMPGTQRMAGVSLIMLTIAVFPANLHMAVNPDLFSEFPAWALYARLPLQALIVWWIWRATQPGPVHQSSST